MKRWMAIGICFLALVPLAKADEASKRAKVEELITVMHMDQLMNQMMAAMKTQVDRAMQSNPDSGSLTPAQKKAMADFQDKSMKLIAGAVSWPKLKPEFVDLYTQTFTEEEIDGMVTFYKSSAGQAVLTKMPQLMTATMQDVQQKMATLQPQLKQLQDEFVQQMEAGSSSASPKQTAPATKHN